MLTSILYNGEIISQTQEPVPVNVTYDGRTIATLGEDDEKTLMCRKKIMFTDIHVGNRILRTQNKIVMDNIGISVGRVLVDLPTITGSYTYTGQVIRPTLNYDTTKVKVTGEQSGTNAGNYQVTFTLKDKSNYKWANETDSDITLTWTIAKMSLTIPSITGTYTYTGEDIVATVSGFNSTYETQTGGTETEAGNHNITWTLKDIANTQWSNGTTAAQTKSWTIAPYILPTPYQTGEVKATGSPVSPEWVDYYPEIMTISGDTSATAPGIYYVTFTPVSTNFTFSTGFTVDVAWVLKNDKIKVLIAPSSVGDATNCYIMINGQKAYTANYWEVDPDTQITCYVKGQSSQAHGQVFSNTERVLNVTSNTVSNCNITLQQDTVIFLGYQSQSNYVCGQICVYQETWSQTNKVAPLIYEDKSHNNYVTLWYCVTINGNVFAMGTGRGGGSLAEITSYTPTSVPTSTIGENNFSITANWSGDSQTKTVTYYVFPAIASIHYQTQYGTPPADFTMEPFYYTVSASEIPTLTYSGKQFIGWYWDSSYTTKVIEGSFVPDSYINTNCTWYAKWLTPTTTSITLQPYQFIEDTSGYSSITNPTNPVGKGSSNTTYAQVTTKTGANVSSYAGWLFNTSSIPEDATINSISCSAKGYISSTSGISGNMTIEISDGTTLGTSSNLSTSTSAKTITCSTTTADKLAGGVAIYISATRTTSSTSTARTLRFYGADLTINYTYYT